MCILRVTYMLFILAVAHIKHYAVVIMSVVASGYQVAYHQSGCCTHDVGVIVRFNTHTGLNYSYDLGVVEITYMHKNLNLQSCH